MTDRRPMTSDSFLVAWFEDGPTTMPDRVVDVVADRIGRTRQRRSWRLLWRLPMNTQIKLVAGLAAVLVLAVAGWSLLPRSGVGPGGPSPTATTVPTPSPSPYPCEEGTGCLGELPGGPQQTSQFEPAFTYTAPAGWFNQIDLPTLVGITPPDQPADMILVWSGAVPAERTAACVLQAKAGVGSTAGDWMTYFRSHPGLVGSNIRETLTIGGRHAESIDVRVAAGWTPPCPDDRALHTVPLIKTPLAAGDGYGIAGEAAARVYLIDVGDAAVVVTLYAYAGGDTQLASQVALGESVVTSFVFKP